MFDCCIPNFIRYFEESGMKTVHCHLNVIGHFTTQKTHHLRWVFLSSMLHYSCSSTSFHQFFVNVRNFQVFQLTFSDSILYHIANWMVFLCVNNCCIRNRLCPQVGWFHLEFWKILRIFAINFSICFHFSQHCVRHKQWLVIGTVKNRAKYIIFYFMLLLPTHRLELNRHDVWQSIRFLLIEIHTRNINC